MGNVAKQLSLFDAPGPAVAPADPNVKPADRPRLAGACLRVLERLRKGPATTIELIQCGGGTRAPGRVHDLRKHGYAIECKDHGGGKHVYTLMYEP